VLLNLVLNGSDAMSATPLADRRLYLAARRAGPGEVHLSVRDRGTGIPPAMLERMFDPFVTSKAQGLGLGLSISRTIVSAHGGRLWAENNEDGGATVHCLLAAPRRSEAPRDAGRVIAILQPADPPSQGEQASGA
jgi:two-component system, LuxR family, sensor kinase FixL